MSAVRFKIRPQAQRELERTPQMALFLKEKVEPIARRVREIAPRGSSAPGEHYADMIKTDVGIEKGRLIGRVNALKFTAHFLEFGTSKTPTFAPLRRAAESLGYRLRGGR